MEYKKNTYYDNPKDNTAFECCIDIMSRLILKYGPDMLEKLDRDNIRDTRCEEAHHVL